MEKPDQWIAQHPEIAAAKKRTRLLATLKNMETYGGGFAAALAEAWYRADMNNSAKLERAFADLLEDYAPEKWTR